MLSREGVELFDGLRRFLSPADESLSDCGRYVRWSWRCWDATLPVMGIIVPSPYGRSETGGRRVGSAIRLADANGFGSFCSCHVFSYRPSGPYRDVFRAAKDPVGPWRWSNVAEDLSDCGVVVCAWGELGDWCGHGSRLLNFLSASSLAGRLRFLGFGRTGVPIGIRSDCHLLPLLEYRDGPGPCSQARRPRRLLGGPVVRFGLADDRSP